MATIIRRRNLGRTSCREIAKYMKSPCKVRRSDKRLPEDTLYIRWGCTVNVPCRSILNVSEAIHRVSDKVRFRVKLSNEGLAPKTWVQMEDVPDEELAKGVVIRPARHSRGRHTYLANNRMDLAEYCRVCGDGYYISQYIKKVAEYRVFVVQGRIACVAEKTPSNPDDLAWNVAKGGRFDVLNWDNWPLRACKMAIESFLLSGLDFGGVDVMVDSEGNPYILEINSAPSLTSPYRQQCMAKCFDYIIENGKAIIPLIEKRGGYSKFIHPAVCNRAQLVEEV